MPYGMITEKALLGGMYSNRRNGNNMAENPEDRGLFYMKGVSYVWFFDRVIVRGAYERAGGI